MLTGGLRKRLVGGSSGGLLGLGAIQAVIYGVIWKLSQAFQYGQGHESRPILLVWALLTCLFVLYLLGIVSVWKGADSNGNADLTRRLRRRRLAIIFGFAILFRGILFLAEPIQEVDIYRYIWDGNVVNTGVNPYRFSPEQVAEAGEDAPAELAALNEMTERSEALGTIFSRVHFKEVPTVYPPLSQGIFAIATALTPDRASLSVHLGMVKGLLLLFDIGTLFAIWAIMSLSGYPPERVIAYAWCPLVIKEFANSGHLDSIAVFMTACAVLLLLAARSRRNGEGRVRSEYRRNWAAVAFWAGGTLAKVYPIVLMPLLIRWWWRHQRWRVAGYLVAYGVLVASGYGVINGFFTPETSNAGITVRNHPDRSAGIPKDTHADTAHDPLEGLRTFLKRWEINDLLFAIVFENIRPRSVGGAEEREVVTQRPWFVFVPGKLANALSRSAAAWLRELGMQVDPFRSAFLLTQGVAGAAMAVIWLAIAARRWPESESRFLINGVFLSLAWLWYLSPTQNPWYWTWAMPFIGLAQRSWFLTSGFALIYYLRFWLMYHYGETGVLMTGYTGTQFFDYIVVWFEHGIVLSLLAYEWLARRHSGFKKVKRNGPVTAL